MNEKKDEKWLDELICRGINTEKPQFDAEKWQQQYPEEVKILKSCAKQTSADRRNVWRMIYKSKITKLAAAAVILIAIGLSLVHRGPGEQVDSPSIRKVTKSPAELLTARSLTIAYGQGDIHTVEDQLDRALEMLGPRPEKISIQKLLAEFNGT